MNKIGSVTLSWHRRKITIFSRLKINQYACVHLQSFKSCSVSCMVLHTGQMYSVLLLCALHPIVMIFPPE